ncbi:MAG TPA: MauE/DoxX family redox-associated membrane protein [Steroidobacteraceae bacterium]|nr:MauE/DoxX family redox-associated membrane protein [Steroidobacteraceae bacterium]
MLDPAIGLLLVGCCALLFVSAALHKLRAPARFSEVLRAYRVLPAPLVRLAFLIPLLELTIGLGLIAPAVRTAAGGAGAALLVLYGGAIALNLARGRRDLACGCGGPDEARPIAPWMVVRNLVLAALLVATLAPWQSRALGATDLLTIGGGVAVATLLYVSLERLLGRVAPRTAAFGGPR